MIEVFFFSIFTEAASVFYKLLPVRSLYMIMITAITIKIWIMLPRSGKAK
jgi:hypothetical protein